MQPGLAPDLLFCALLFEVRQLTSQRQRRQLSYLKHEAQHGQSSCLVHSLCEAVKRAGIVHQVKLKPQQHTTSSYTDST